MLLACFLKYEVKIEHGSFKSSFCTKGLCPVLFFFFLSSHFIKREMHIHNKLGSEAYKSDIQIALFTGNSLRPS